jgi:hypothetical protein
MPGAGYSTSAFVDGDPRLGHFWTAGNPAGLVTELPPTRTDFRAEWSRQRGDYRRPLDPAARILLRASGRAWKALTPSFALLGRVAADRERLDPGTHADDTEAFASSPFITTDTSGAAVRRVRTRLEGAASWKLADWALGVSLGYEARENTSIESPVVRRVLSEMPGLVLGATRPLGGLRAGLFGRFRHRAETIRVIELAGDARVHELLGWTEPPSIDVLGAYHRRREESVFAGGASLAGSVGAYSFTAFAELDRLRERLWDQENNDPDRDRWDANGWSAGAALQGRVGTGWLVTLNANVASVSGDALPQRDSVIAFAADERSAGLRVDLRRSPEASGWAAAISADVRVEWRDRRDLRLNLATNVRSFTPSLRVEIGRQVNEKLFVSGGGDVSAYGPTSRIPDPAVLGPRFDAYHAADFALQASRATSLASVGHVRYRVGKGASLWLSARVERSSPSGNVTVVLRPEGSRAAVSVSGGVTTGLP